MIRFLLDINALIALIDLAHVQHDCDGWAAIIASDCFNYYQ
jgi:hypothetical protein